MIATLLAASVLAVSCSSHYSTKPQDSASGAALYRLSGPDALLIAHSALTEMFPGRKITEIPGPTPGYSTTYRMMLDTYSQQVLAVPAIGSDQSGQEVHGYYFDVSGSGTALISGHVKNGELFDRVKASADATGTAVAVTAVRVSQDSRADAAARDSEPDPSDRSDQNSVGSRLRRLQDLRDRGLVSDDEFRMTRERILRDL